MSAGRLAELIRERQPCVVLTGAGVSTASGIPDFRSATGIWAQYDPMEYASIDAFRADPLKVWEFYRLRLEMLGAARPNAAHRAIADLERRGFVQAVVTQNIDLLHEKAGSQALVEVHGSIRTCSCLRCGVRVSLVEVLEMLEELPAPVCPGCGSVLKPDVVMFGELMPEGETAQAFELAAGASLLVAVGTSLEVWPIAGLPQETIAGGGVIAIVNRGSTPYDGQAALVVDADAAETLADVARLLGPAP